MGLLDIPAPIFGVIDTAMATVLPAAWRIALWAVGLAVGTMLLYKTLSPQAKIGVAKREAREARRALNGFDGEFADAGPLIKRQFATAMRHIGLVLPATLISVLPLLCFIVWADNHFSYRLPTPGAAAPALATVPARVSDWPVRWQRNGPGRRPAVSLGTPNHATRHYPMQAPVTVIAHHSAWNWLVGNPLGYLPDDAPMQAVTIALPTRTFIDIGPGWMRGWLAIFFPVMFIVSLAMFRWVRIE